MTRRGEIRDKCKFDGCNSREHSREGYCSAHARKFRAGLPLSDVKPFHSYLPWLQDRINWDSDECLIWPFSRNKAGYGQVHFAGKQANAHRAMCILAHGAPPFDRAEAAHNCGHGHLGCVNPRHLEWKTASANNLDKLRHGTMRRGDNHPNMKLSYEDVQAIRILSKGIHRNLIARVYDVSPITVWGIVTNRLRVSA